jgi:hypothetical protein
MKHATVQKLAGHGVKGLEHCPTLFHIDLSEDEFEALLANPAETMKRLAISCSASNITLSRWNESYSPEKGRVTLSAAVAQLRPRACCYVTDEAMICHRHG